MEHDVYTFQKNYEKRLKEYRELLCTRDLLPASQVKSEWSRLAETIIEPVGWRAIWRVPVSQCDELELTFPKDIEVLVEFVEVQSLNSEVSILNMPEDAELPKEITVSLIDLYPTIEQDDDILNVKITADFIDKLRFFDHYLWMPWDLDDDDDTQDWSGAHLEMRLKLYYDMQSGGITSEMILNIQYIVRESKRIQDRISSLEEQVGDDEMRTKPIMCELMELLRKRNDLKFRFEMYEDPYKRALMVWKHHNKSYKTEESKAHAEPGGGDNAYLVWPGGLYKHFMQFLSDAQPFIAQKQFKTQSSLQDCLDQANAGESIILAEGNYSLLGLGGLEKGGSIRGLTSPDSTVIKPCWNVENVLLNCNGGVFHLENLTINVEKMDIAVLVHEATVHLRNCHFISQNAKSSRNIGLLVLGGGCIVARNCQFSGFGTAVTLYPKGEASLTSCTIQGCRVGIQLQEAKLTLMKSNISECCEFGIKVDVSKQLSHVNKEVGSVVLLNGVGSIQLSDSNIEKNAKGDVCIFQGCSADMENPVLSFTQINNPPAVTSGRTADHGDE